MSEQPTEEQADWQTQNLAEKAWAWKFVQELNAQMGFEYDPTAMPEKAQEMMRVHGIRAEDNLFSRDIIRTRYPDEYGQEDK